MIPKLVWLSKNNVLAPNLDLVRYPVDALKPHKFQLAGLVLKVAHHPFLVACADNFLSGYCAAYLHEGHVAMNLIYRKQTSAVFITEGVVLNQIAICMDV